MHWKKSTDIIDDTADKDQLYYKASKAKEKSKNALIFLLWPDTENMDKK